MRASRLHHDRVFDSLGSCGAGKKVLKSRQVLTSRRQEVNKQKSVAIQVGEDEKVL